jgi:hypothetical protein
MRRGHSSALSLIMGHRGLSAGLLLPLETMHENLAALIEDADVHGTRMPVDAAITLVLGVVKSP